MAYIWKFHSNIKLEEGEENDIQICIVDSEQETFLKRLGECVQDEKISVEMTSSKVPIGSPYHIDHPSSNFSLPNSAYSSLTLCLSRQSQDIVVDAENLRLELTKDSVCKLIALINATRNYPALYGNTLDLNCSPSVKLVSWGCYEGKPVFF